MTSAFQIRLRELLEFAGQSSPRIALYILLPALILRILTALLNTGYFAVDDYNLLGQAIPVQIAGQLSGDTSSLVTIDRIRSPLPQWLVYSTARLAYWCGLESALGQIRVVFVLMGLVSMGSVYYALRVFQLLGRPYEAAIAASLVGFHFALPFISTRTLIEGMSAPLLTASVYYFLRYYTSSGRDYVGLAASILVLATAAMLRFQVGILALAMLPFIYFRKRPLDFAVFLGAGLIATVLTGLPDLFLRGRLHDALINYVDYNLRYSSNYGTSPFYEYLLLAILIVLPPAFWSRYRGFGWRDSFQALMPIIAIVALFFVSHSAVPHKEPRFLVPILPLFFVCLAPLARYLLERSARASFQLYLIVANLILLVLLGGFTFQSNMIDLVRYLERQNGIRRLVLFEDSMDYFPFAYSRVRTIGSLGQVIRLQPPVELSEACDQVLILRADKREAAAAHTARLKRVASFHGSPLERIVIFVNPTGNKRRRAMEVYAPAHCEAQLTP